MLKKKKTNNTIVITGTMVAYIIQILAILCFIYTIVGDIIGGESMESDMLTVMLCLLSSTTLGTLSRKRMKSE